MKINENMNIFTIRKKILLASKLIGVALIVSRSEERRVG